MLLDGMAFNKYAESFYLIEQNGASAKVFRH